MGIDPESTMGETPPDRNEVQLSLLAARIKETEVTAGPPPTTSIIGPAGERAISEPGAATARFYDDLPSPPEYVPKVASFNDVAPATTDSKIAYNPDHNLTHG